MDDQVGTGCGGAAAFLKMHGLGNDFVVMDLRAGGAAEGSVVTPALARAVGDRRFGVGFDQLATIADSAAVGVAAEIVFWNADGSVAGACGNATRCVADVLMAEGGVEALTLRTARGDLACRRRADGWIEVDMGAPQLGWAQVPLAHEVETAAFEIEPVEGLTAEALRALGPASALSMGNPHAVLFVPDLAGVAIEAIGPVLERHPMFPQRANIGVAQVISPAELRLRVWERGAGLTLACGSGACAALVAGVRRGLCERSARIVLDGGALELAWPEDDAGVLMAGPAQKVFAGRLDPSLLAGAGS